MLLAQLHNDIQEIHRIKVELFTKGNLAFDIAKLFIRSNFCDNVEYHFLAFVFGHVSRLYLVRKALQDER